MELIKNCDTQIGNNNDDARSVWVFGYGALCWFPGVKFSESIIGYVNNYSRKFWQGNRTHRGDEKTLGVVATLVADKGEKVWGCAYKVIGDDALEHLNNREIVLGGYETAETNFYPRQPSVQFQAEYGKCLPVLLYIATDQSEHWLGEKSLDELAEMIANSSGPSGHNAEYLFRLANFMKDEIPDVEDDHLFTLERLVKEILKKLNKTVASVMGNLDIPRILRN